MDLRCVKVHSLAVDDWMHLLREARGVQSPPRDVPF